MRERLTGAPIRQLNQMATLSEQALYHAGPQAGGDAAAVSFQAELVLEVGDTLQDHSHWLEGRTTTERPVALTRLQSAA